MSKLLANQIANYGDDAPIEIKEGLNIPAGKPIQAAGSAGISGQVLSSTGTSIAWSTPFDGDYNSLTNRPTIPAAQVNADWNATSGVSLILNKPVVPLQPSVTTAAAGTAALSYNSTNGEFTFTPPDLSGYATEAWVGSQGYLTSYTETDTLDSVVARGNNTGGDIVVSDNLYLGGSGTTSSYRLYNTGSDIWIQNSQTGGKIKASAPSGFEVTGGLYSNTLINVQGGVTLYEDSGLSGSEIRLTTTGTGMTFYGDIELGSGDITTTGKLYYSNNFADLTALNAVNAGTYHGMFAHVHSEGHGYFAHAGGWIQMLDTGSALGDLADVNLATAPQTGQVLKYDGSNWVAAADGTGGGGIALTDLSVTTAAAGTAALSYNNVSGVFTYTPPDLSGYLTSYTETDPVFSASAAAGITSGQITNWTAAYNWGNHALVGYLTSETSHADVVVDGDFTTNGLLKRTGAGTYTSVTDNSSNWDTAFGWGDHSTQGYLTTLALNGVSDVTITSPQTNDVLTYNGSAWVNSPASGGGASVTISDTPPAASPGDLWWESDTGRLKIRYQDTDSTQWVDVSPPLADATSIGGSGTVAMLASLIPDVNDAYDLGNAEYKIRDIYEANPSDARLKTDVVDYTGGLAFVESLRVVDFTWKEDVAEKAGKRETGLIAQEVKEALDASNYNSWRLHTDGDTQGVDKKQLIPALISAIQELSARVKELENK